MTKRRKLLAACLVALSLGLLSCKEKQKDAEEPLRERYEKLGAEKDALLREQKEQRNIEPR